MSSDKKKRAQTHTINNRERTKKITLYGSWHRVNHPNYYYYYYHVKLICVCQIKIVIGACSVSVCHWGHSSPLSHLFPNNDPNIHIYTGWQCLQFVIKICRHQHVLNATFISTHCTWFFLWYQNVIQMGRQFDFMSTYSIQNEFTSSKIYRKKDHV